MDEVVEWIATVDWAGAETWWRVGLFEREAAAGAPGVVVLEVVGEDAAEVPLAGDEDPVEALSADRLDKPCHLTSPRPYQRQDAPTPRA